MGKSYFFSNEKNLRYVLSIGFFLLLGSVVSFSQRSIEGTVLDQNSTPLIGVNIMISGTSTGAITDLNGYFSLNNVSNEDVLIVTYVGFETQEIPVGVNTELNIVLSSASSMLDEVVVVGYGSTSRRNVTGSVTKVDMKSTENLPNTNVSQALRGRVAGVQFTDNGRPGQNGSILVRGPRSLSAGNSPLIVLDGIFFNGSLIDINPNDIESMEVLKDASAAAIYGSRAANGVILITSKRGVSEKPRITINSFFGLSDWSYRPILLTPERYIQKSKDIRTQQGIPFDPNDPESFLTLSEAENFRQGNIIDPYDQISQQGRIHSTDVSLSSSTKNTNYYISASMSQENGLIFNDQIKRVAFRVNVENTVTDWLKIGTNSMFSENDQSGIPARVSFIERQSPFGNWYRDDGSTPTQFTVTEDQGISLNPLYNSFLSSDENVRSNLFANFYTIIDVPKIEGLTFRVNYSNNYRWIRDYQFTAQDQNLPNTNTTSASKRNWKANDWVLENILDYKLKINELHNVDITLMYGANRNFFETTTASAQQLETDVFGWDNLGVGGVLTNTSYAERVTGISSMARLNYRFKDRYLFTFTARRDGSSVFAANNKYATFPSAAISWIASDEPFLSNVNSIDYLKLRTSYGAVGNQAISPYQSLSLASSNRYVFGDGGPSVLGVFPSNISSDDLKWETTYIGNIGLDFGLFDYKLTGSLELYHMRTNDLLVERSLPSMTGYNAIWTNLGQVNNQGIEVTLNTVNYRKDKFEWNSGLVFSYNENKIVSLYGEDLDGDGREDDDLGNRWFIGHPIDVHYDFVFDGIYQAGDEIPAGSLPGFIRFADLNEDGVINAAGDRQIIGQSGQPKYRWGLTNNFNYGNFQLSIFINAMQGWIGTFNQLDPPYTGDPLRPVNMLDAGYWTEENPSTTRPSLIYRRSVLGHNFYLSRNFIRIQDVSLAYTFPQSFTQKNKLSNLSIFVSAKNLVTFTDWLGTNPETVTQFPMARMVTSGVKIGF